MDRLILDLRYALRGMRASPGLTTVAVLSLALGVGPTSAIFSVIDAMGFRPLPIQDPAHLLEITSPSAEDPQGSMSYPDYVDLREGARLLESVAVEGPLTVAFSGEGLSPQVVMGSTVSGTYFQTLGIQAVLGRAFLTDEDRTPGSHPVVVIGNRLWKRAFDADPGVIGRTVRLNTVTCTIVGVMPVGFTGTQAVLAPELWVPSMMWPAIERTGAGPTLDARGRRGLKVLARARRGVTLEQAATELGGIGSRLAQAWPETNGGRRVVVAYEQTARRRVVGQFGSFALAIVSLILLIAAANVAGLLIGRSEARRQELATRAALGATRGQLVRQLLTESALLAFGAAALGALLAFWIVRLLPSFIPPMPILMNFDFRIDSRVLLFTLMAALFALPLFGLAPALLASRADVAIRLKPDARSGRARFRSLLLAAQVAGTLVLLVGAGLVTRGLLNARSIDPGFVIRPMMFATMSPPILGYDAGRTRDFYRALLERLSAVPGIERATLVRHMPLNALYGGGAVMEAWPPGAAPEPGAPKPLVRYNTIGERYFDTMGTRIIRGRDFTAADAGNAVGVAIVNETLAKRLWPGDAAVGRYLTVRLPRKDAAARDVQVVGVVQDGRYLRLTEEPQPYFYLPWAQQYTSEMTVLVRFTGNAEQVARAFRNAVLEVDPAMPTLGLVTLDEHLRLALVVERTTAVLAAILASIGLLLSVVGLYGVVAFIVSRRTRDIGIRMALGAGRGQVVREVMTQGGRPVLAGIGTGLVLAFGGARVISSALYGVSPMDPLVFGASTLLVALVASAAAYLPARRAARVDPSTALRADC